MTALSDVAIVAYHVERHGVRHDDLIVSPARWSGAVVADLGRFLVSQLMPLDDVDVRFSVKPVDGKPHHCELLVTCGDHLTAWTSPFPVKLAVAWSALRQLQLSAVSATEQ